MENLHHGSINGGYLLSVKTLLLRSNSYVNAKRWEDLVLVFTGSLGETSLDEMTLLLHTTIPGPYGWRSKFVRPVSYTNLDEVPELLLSPAPSALRTGPTPSHQQQPPVEEAMVVQPNGDDDEQVEQKHIDIPQEKIVDGEEAEAVMSDGDREEIDETKVNAAKTIQGAYRRHLERKRAGAAKKIQAAYRHRLKRKSVIRKGIDATQAHYWNLLREKSTEMEWTKDSRYYLLFRIPLADILVCLDTIGAFAESEKKGTNKRMRTAGDKDLEELMGACNQYRCDDVDCT